MEKTFGVCRLVYNLALETKIRAWHSAHKNPSAYDLMHQIPELKKEYPWMAEVDSQAINAVIRNLDRAYSHFFSGSGFPKFKTKKGRQSFRCPANKREVDFFRKTITIPKIPGIRARINRTFDGQIKTITISKTPTGRYFASVLVDNKKELPQKPPVDQVKTKGIDLGIHSFVVTSDGKYYEPNRYLKNSLRRLKCLQRKAAKKIKGSKNRKKANLRIARIHEKIANQRSNYIHLITKRLVCDSQVDTFVMEDLNVTGMLKNHKLAQALSDVSFGEFVRQMKYKCAWYGKNLIQIGRFEPSSKRCNFCGEINENLTLLDRWWICSFCGEKQDRDFNAARNIRRIGLNKYTRPGGPEEPVERWRITPL